MLVEALRSASKYGRLNGSLYFHSLCMGKLQKAYDPKPIPKKVTKCLLETLLELEEREKCND